MFILQAILYSFFKGGDSMKFWEVSRNLKINICKKIHEEHKNLPRSTNLWAKWSVPFLGNFFTNLLKILWMIFVMFMFFKKATKIYIIFTVNLTLCSKRQIDGEDFVNFLGFLRKYELCELLDNLFGWFFWCFE